MQEKYYYWKRILTSFFNDVLKWTFIMLIPAFLIVLAVSTWRYNALAYLLAFLICLGVNWFMYFRKGEVKDEFKENQ